MIGRLVGRLVVEDALADAGSDLVVDVGGVGYEVMAPLGTRGRLEADASGIITLHIHTNVREDAFQLFGFVSRDERDAFRTIIGISNIGPKLGLAILGAVTVHDLAALVARGEIGKLTSIPGVGKKTAERLVLELKGKLSAVAQATKPRADAVAQPMPKGSKVEVLVATLTRMGFRPVEAERAVASLGQGGRDLEDTAIGELVREALTTLSR